VGAGRGRPGPECRFASRGAYDADLAAGAGSRAFLEARRVMHALLDRFERQVYETDELTLVYPRESGASACAGLKSDLQCASAAFSGV
jgi:hypothetical protein